jgi:secretion/DNA translocation related TadE-like protein
MSSRTTRQPRGTARDDDGVATVMVLGLCCVLLAVTMVVLAVAVLVVARHRAESTADLAAISAARHAFEGESVACEAAAGLARRQRVRLDACRLDDLDVVVEVSLPAPGRLGSFGRLHATARAGAR